MAKKAIKKDPHAVEVGIRLKKIIDAYFDRQKVFAEKVGISEYTLSRYISGAIPISDKTATSFQMLIGVNKDYLLNGNMPMILDERKPLREHLVRKADKSIEERTKQIQTDTSRAFISQKILASSGKRQILAGNGTINLIDFDLSGVENPMLVSVISLPFCEKYKLSNGVSLMISSEYQEGEIVLAEVGFYFILAEYYKDKLVDIADQSEHLISDVNIIGKACKKIEIF